MSIKYSVFLILTYHCWVQAGVFSSLPYSELLRLREKAQARVNLVNQYEGALTGENPEADEEILRVAYQTFADAGTDWNASIRFNGVPSQDCRLYFRNTNDLIREIRTNYPEVSQIPRGSEKGLLLRSRLEILEFFLKGELNLVRDGGEGGISPITGSGTQCPLVNRGSLKISSSHLLRASDYLSKLYWGQRSVRNPFPISNPLLSFLNREERIDRTWSVAKYSTETLIGIVLIAIVTRKILPDLVPLLSARGQNILKLASLLTVASYGAYKGLVYSSESVPNSIYSGERWSRLQEAVSTFMSLDMENAKKDYYQYIYAYENAVLILNREIIRSYTPQMKMAEERFGSLDAARKLAIEKGREIDEEIKLRK